MTNTPFSHHHITYDTCQYFTSEVKWVLQQRPLVNLKIYIRTSNKSKKSFICFFFSFFLSKVKYHWKDFFFSYWIMFYTIVQLYSLFSKCCYSKHSYYLISQKVRTFNVNYVTLLLLGFSRLYILRKFILIDLNWWKSIKTTLKSGIVFLLSIFYYIINTEWALMPSFVVFLTLALANLMWILRNPCHNHDWITLINL